MTAGKKCLTSSSWAVEVGGRMRTPITYYGGKQRLAGKIISMMPAHKIYCEPFFGGGAVFFRKPKSGIEVINDHDERLINFYSCVQNRFDDLQKMVNQTLHSESIYLHAKDVWNDRTESDEIEKAWAIWLITNGSFAGSMHGGWKWCNGTSGSNCGVYLSGKRKDFSEALHNRIEHVQISCRDALRVIIERDSQKTFFYLDPPYPGSYQGHYGGYSHKDFYNLLNILSGIKGKFILSNYWCQTLRWFILKNGWNFEKIEVNCSVASLGETVQKRTEVLVYNYDIQKSLFS